MRSLLAFVLLVLANFLLNSAAPAQSIFPSGPAALDANGSQAVTVIGGRPSGCPHAYCGCGLRKFLGIADKRLNLALNWIRLFPHTSARPGVAAARAGHVMQLVRHVAGNRWIVRDYNSGGGLSRIHERAVAGFVFVDPSAGVTR